MAAAAKEAKKLLDAGNVEAAKEKAKDALKTSDKAGQAAAAMTLVKANIAINKLKDAKDVVDKELAGFKEADFLPGIISMLAAKAELSIALKKSEDAVVAAREAWPLSKKADDKQLQAVVLVTMVKALCARNSTKEALRAASSSLAMVKDSGDKSLVAEMLCLTSKLQIGSGSPQEALASVEEALGMYKELDSKSGEALALITLGSAQIQTGKFDEAIASANSALDLLRPMKQAKSSIAALDVIVDAETAAGQTSMGMKAVEDEFEKMKAAGISSDDEAVMLEKMVALAAGQGFTLEAINKLDQLIAAMGASGDKRGEAMKTLERAEMHFSVNHIKDAAHVGEKAIALFAELGDTTMEEKTKKFVTSCYVTLGQHAKAPYRSEALAALRNFIKAVETRSIDEVKMFEATLDKASSAIKETEINGALEALFEKDDTALKFMEELGWDVAAFKTPMPIYQYSHEGFYLQSIFGGMGFGPTFRGVYPYRKGKRSDPNGSFPCAIAQMPAGEAWWGALNFRHGLMDGMLQTSGLDGNPPH